MTVQNDKFTAMIGFARRSRKIVYGADNIKKTQKIKLVAADCGASENLIEEMRRIALKKKVKLILVNGLDEITNVGAKAIGILDSNMAKAMLDCAQASDNYKIQP